MKLVNLIVCALLINNVAYASAGHSHDDHAPLNLAPTTVSNIGSASLSTLNLEIELSDSLDLIDALK